MNASPMITCPGCNTEFPLTETLAQPLIANERAKLLREVEERAVGLETRESELEEQSKQLSEQQKALDAERGELDVLVEQRLMVEREALTKAAEKRAAANYGAQLSAAEQQLAEKDLKLRQAQEAELTIRKDRQALEEQKRELELEVERRLHTERLRVREATQKEEEESHRLKLAERDKVIEDMRKQVEELRRKSEQGSQQLQGEVLELELEALLQDSFPGDQIEPVPTGRSGGDVIQHVIAQTGTACGAILWESKRAKNWSNEWFAKNRDDQRSVGATVGAIVSTVLPKNVTTFDLIDGVWVTSIRCALPLAKALRRALIETALAKAAAQGRDGKMERIYGYLTGPQFRQRVSAITEAYIAMRDDLDAERRTMNKHWAKRERHLDLLITGAAGMYGDLQGIAGKSMLEIEGLDTPLLESESVVGDKEGPSEKIDSSPRS